MHIMDYNRVVADLNGKSADQLKEEISKSFDIELADTPSPSRATEFGMYLGGSWYRPKDWSQRPCKFFLLFF
jgi:uncharacterized protein (DUF1015 family)